MMAMHTNPRNIQKDVRRKILKAAEALVDDDIAEAYHQLYAIADPMFLSYTPWEAISHGIGDAKMVWRKEEKGEEDES